MQIVYDILRIFQTEFPDYVERMTQSNHHFDKDNLCPWHLCGGVWTHTMMVYNAYIQKLKTDFAPDERIKKMIAVILLCHDIGKIYTRAVPKGQFGKISFYGHGYASVQPCIEFINKLKNYRIDFSNDELYEILCVISNHIEYYDADDKKRSKIYHNNYRLYALFEFMLEFDTTGSIKDAEGYRKSDFLRIPENSLHNDNPTITIYCGVPASGKDFIAEEFETGEVISLDNIRVEEYLKNAPTEDIPVDIIEVYNNAYKYCNEFKVNVDQLFIKKAKEILINGKNVVMCIASLKKSRTRYISQFNKKYPVVIKYVVAGLETMYERDRTRNSKNLGKMIINKFAYNQQIPMLTEGADYVMAIDND